MSALFFVAAVVNGLAMVGEAAATFFYILLFLNLSLAALGAVFCGSCVGSTFRLSWLQ